MTTPASRETPSPGAARLAGALVTSFLVLLGLLHLLEPAFDPAYRLISEYALGRLGWLMALAFFALGAGLLTLRRALRGDLHGACGRCGAAGLTLVGVALVGAGVFTTEPLDVTMHSTAHVIHRACGGVVILGFPVVATLLARALRSEPRWANHRLRLRAVTALAWCGLLGFLASMAALGRPPDAAIGWQNRLMMVTYCVWLLTVARSVGRLGAAIGPR